MFGLILFYRNKVERDDDSEIIFDATSASVSKL